MHILDKYADLIKTLRANGWEVGPHTEISVFLIHPGCLCPISLNSTTCALFDAFYQKGFKDGFERGAYEAETKEDVEPVKVAAAPVTGDWFDLLRRDRGLREWEVSENSVGGGMVQQTITVKRYTDKLFDTSIALTRQQK